MYYCQTSLWQNKNSLQNVCLGSARENPSARGQERKTTCTRRSLSISRFWRTMKYKIRGYHFSSKTSPNLRTAQIIEHIDFGRRFWLLKPLTYNEGGREQSCNFIITIHLLLCTILNNQSTEFPVQLEIHYIFLFFYIHSP